MKTESDVIHAADPDPRFLNNSNTIPPAAYFIFSFQHIKKGFKTEQIVKKKKQRTLSDNFLTIILLTTIGDTLIDF